MRRIVFFALIISIVMCLFVSCATSTSEATAEPVDASAAAAPVAEEKPAETIPSNLIVFKGDQGKLELVLDKDDMSAKLYSFGLQVKQGTWTSAAIGFSSNIQIYIDGKPVNLFFDPLTNEYSIEMQYESIKDVVRCDSSWMGKTRKFNSLEESNGEIICYGPSNFAYWTTMATDLAPYLVHNHSVGGVTDKQLLEAAPTMVYPYNPKVVMLLTGSNDYANITDISDVDAVVATLMDAKIKLYEDIHANLPEARIVVVGGMPTIKRAMFTQIVLIVNEKIEEYCSQHAEYLTYCSLGELTYDVATETYKEDRFLADGLHLTPETRVLMANECILPVLEEIDAPAGPTVLEVQTCKLYDSVDQIPFYDGKAEEPYFEVYQVESEKPNKALIVFHGGGFMARSVPKESTAIAEYFSREYGYTCFVCYYRINTNYQAIISDGIRFLKQIRSDADKYNIDPDQICLMGFSAGASLSLAISQHYMDEEYLFSDELDQVDGKPNYLCLLYPGTQLYSESKNKYLKWNEEEIGEKYNYSLHVPTDMGSTFIAQAEDDTTTPIAGTYTLVDAMKEKGIDYELHVFSHGEHGFSLGNNEETVTWMGLFADWFNRY